VLELFLKSVRIELGFRGQTGLNSQEEVETMPIYVMLTTLTDEGRKTIKDKPERIREVNKEVENMGAKLLAQYAVLGPYDFVNILAAPDNQVISKVAIDLGSRGTLQTMTMAAVEVDDFIANLKKK
jgi:uncharacterized protein with GYD domain